MEGIFNNAKFGDKFRTRDDRMALFVGWDGEMEHAFLYIKEGGMQFYGEAEYNLDGTVFIGGSSQCDIVSRWSKPIDEEELDKIACEKYPDYPLPFGEYESMDEVREAFKAGYCAAKK